MLFSTETGNMNYNMAKLSTIQLNEAVYNRIAGKNYVILSSGITILWKKLALQFDMKHIIADTNISADTKYFVVNMLQNKGYSIIAYGDGKNDLYMLKQANKGYLYIGSYLSRSLKDTDLSGIELIYDKTPYILEDVTDTVSEEIAICKSNSGINGSRLADAHIRLGKILGEAIQRFVPNFSSAVIVLDRGGRFFGDGVYISFGGVFFPFNPKKDDIPDIHSNIMVIVDSVINTGRSILDTIYKLKRKAPDAEVFIAANVIQEKAVELLKDYKIFAVRTSTNSYVGCRQTEQRNGKGPDTADRLFNYIDCNSDNSKGG